MKNFFGDIEKVTICMGFAIILLGILNAFNATKVPPTLVTGISISGFCLTLADFLSKLNEDYNSKIIKFSTEKLSWFLYLFAAISIICFPYMGKVISMSEGFLAKMSTVSSVIALGLVFVSIGYNNKREALKDAKYILKAYDELIGHQDDAIGNIQKLRQGIGKQMQQLSKQKEEKLIKKNTDTSS